MMPIAPAAEVIGLLSASTVRPPLSWRITARIHCAGILNLCAACWTRGSQRANRAVDDIACSCANTELLGVTTTVSGANRRVKFRWGTLSERFATEENGVEERSMPCQAATKANAVAPHNRKRPKPRRGLAEAMARAGWNGTELTSEF